jgi:hypothetical protein
MDAHQRVFATLFDAALVGGASLHRGTIPDELWIGIETRAGELRVVHWQGEGGVEPMAVLAPDTAAAA